MIGRLDRRQVLAGGAASALFAQLGDAVAGAAVEGVRLGARKSFSFAALKAEAKSIAGRAWRKADAAGSELLEKIDYDAYQKIRFKPQNSLRLDLDGRAPAQLFHLGQYFREPVRIHVVDGADAREVLYSAQLFETPADHPARGLPDGLGFAGFRIMARDLKTDWLAFLGASYFRTSGPFNQYGLSVRGLAIDTAMPGPEEFPRFTEFYLEGSEKSGTTLIVYALLDSPRVAGAYRIQIERVTDARDIHRVVMTIECELHARGTIRRLGVAPFSSMFWYGEGSRNQARDWRPEIHDSDGLAMLSGTGERIWRPINNPPRVMTSAFADLNPQGFGLLQRDRDFVHYLDDGVFYERRASVWVEPLDPWGKGAVHLVEIPTDDEVHDNIAAYWCPDEPFHAGDTRTYRYRLSWLDDIALPDSLGFATATWTGLGGRPGQKRPTGTRKFVIDFQGSVFAGIGRGDGVEILVTSSRGTVSNAYAHPVVDQRERWRALFDVTATGAEPVDLRAYLRRGERALTETWINQYFPEA
ncbi:MAG: glucan biosynthesis protein D [Hyphomicrobium sp.]|nr:glucan biosynthesis protein D [Hyphomicrobium sp.]PPC81927.1 MAG: glucan biosynthesis protein D [Hyphomicrobium sp.]